MPENCPPPSVAVIRDFFLTEFEQAAGEIETTEAIPERLLRQAAEAGVYRLTMPAEHGGCALPVTDYLPYLEAAASGPGAGRMLMHVTNGIWRPLAQFGTPEQRAIIPRLASPRPRPSGRPLRTRRHRGHTVIGMASSAPAVSVGLTCSMSRALVMPTV